MIIVAPPLVSFMICAMHTTNWLRRAWMLIVARCPAVTLLIMAMGLIAFWLWIMLWSIPGLVWAIYR